MMYETQLAVQAQAPSVEMDGAADLVPAGVTEKVELTRSIAELKAQVVLARQFPRDVVRVTGDVIRACSRPFLADKAMYAFPRGGSTVTGPSIRLAEMLAQAYTNITFEVRVLERNKAEHYSEVEAYAWDMEKNTRASRRFRVSHYRDSKKGKQLLTDERDIMEMEQNIGSRYLRGCILRVIPIDIQEAALDQVARTLAGDASVPVADRVRRALPEFDRLGVTPAMLESYFERKLDQLTEADLVEMRGVYTAIRDGVKSARDYFGGKDAVGSSDEATDSLIAEVQA